MDTNRLSVSQIYGHFWGTFFSALFLPAKKKVLRKKCCRNLQKSSSISGQLFWALYGIILHFRPLVVIPIFCIFVRNILAEDFCGRSLSRRSLPKIFDIFADQLTHIHRIIILHYSFTTIQTPNHYSRLWSHIQYLGAGGAERGTLGPLGVALGKPRRHQRPTMCWACCASIVLISGSIWEGW